MSPRAEQLLREGVTAHLEVGCDVGEYARERPDPEWAVVRHGDVVLAVLRGRQPVADTAPSREEEWEKMPTTLLLAGRTLIVFDNVTTVLDNPKFSAAFTTGVWSGRELGFSRNVVVPQRVLWAATGTPAACSIATRSR
jgi:hypothetical protein